MDEEKKEILFGVHPNWKYATTLTNPLFILGIILLTLAFLDMREGKIAEYWYYLSEIPLIGNPNPNITGLIIGATLVVLVFLYRWMLGRMTKYVLDDNAETIIIRQMRMGRTTNSVIYNQVYDCDTRETLMQMLFGGGTLVLRSIDKTVIVIPWVIDPKESRSAILERAGGKEMRVIGTV